MYCAFLALLLVATFTNVESGPGDPEAFLGFKQLDRNDDKFLTTYEAHLGNWFKVDMETLVKAFKSVDTNKDWLLTFEEFRPLADILPHYPALDPHGHPDYKPE